MNAVIFEIVKRANGKVWTDYYLHNVTEGKSLDELHDEVTNIDRHRETSTVLDVFIKPEHLGDFPKTLLTFNGEPSINYMPGSGAVPGITSPDDYYLVLQKSVIDIWSIVYVPQPKERVFDFVGADGVESVMCHRPGCNLIVSVGKEEYV